MSYQLRPRYPLYLAGQPCDTNQSIKVVDKFTDQLAAEVAIASEEIMDSAIESCCVARDEMQSLKPYERRDILNQCWQQFDAMRDEFATILCIEAGKTIKDSRGEVQRMIDTFRIASEETMRIDGEVLNLETTPRAANYIGMTRRFPIGPSAFISPFNFPLNLAAHKIAPAIAAGCPFILKPASYTPISALMIGEILSKTALPKAAFSILPCSRSVGQKLVEDERIRLLSFTGSASVGWELKKQCGKKKVVLELGGNAACIVHEDSNIDDVVSRLIVGIFYQSGQSCISVQRVLIHASVYDQVKARLLEKTLLLKSGDPKDESTFVGPLISEDDAKRLESWIGDAINAGGVCLCGGKRSGSFIAPTLLENVPIDQLICAEEAFGPVAVLQKYEHFHEAIRMTNESRYGLQAGVFTRSIANMMHAWQHLEVGGVICNDVPSWRVDNMPYGGVKDSGLGREGIRAAIEDMTEQRLLVIRNEETLFNNR